ncbi:Clavaminate synthase-like protein [Trametes elegans]|nr:Clavaminate synthase-like protein [Trametes elegans]
MPGLTAIPDFPHDVPTHPLLIIDYELVKNGDTEEIDKLWKAATELGFWYLKNHGVDDDVNAMFDLGQETFALPLEEKLKFDQGNDGCAFGYKPAGVQFLYQQNVKDVVEALAISKDDALAWPTRFHRAYPSTINACMDSVVKPFVQKSLAINHFLIDVLNDRLGLTKGSLATFHNATQASGCSARLIRAPPLTDHEDNAFLNPHTDFGSLSLVYNRLGGLQVLPPGSDKWFYVKPLPGHAVCNVGDALHFFSGGILRSNIHRVVPPPKEQARHERWSLVYFTRPNDAVVLRALAQDSAAVAQAVRDAPPGTYEAGATASEWLTRRLKAQRVANYTSEDSWKDYQGTEGTSILELSAI